MNVASYAGHGTLRDKVMGTDFRRHATPAEVDSMHKLLDVEILAGALGLSSGLEYDPGIYSDSTELFTLTDVFAALRLALHQPHPQRGPLLLGRRSTRSSPSAAARASRCRSRTPSSR